MIPVQPTAPMPETALADGTLTGASGSSVALDQWRGLALVLVLISHGFYFTNRVHGIGRVGVNLFFFISGVLVFRSLSRARETGGWKVAAGFWRRRLKRLYPALFAYVGLMLPATFLLRDVPGTVPGLEPANYLHTVPSALLYAINYWPANQPLSLGHLWSLSCEMQFYLLAPLIFLLGGRTAGRRLLVWGILLFVLLAAGFIGPFVDQAGLHKYHFELAVWPMMLGFCCEHRKDWWQKISPRAASLILWGCLAVFGSGTLLMLFGVEMKKLVIAGGALMVAPCFLTYLHGRMFPGRPGRALAWLGERTYSIYLWQQPLTICRYLPVLWHPVGALIAVFLGGVSFRFFEKPFLSGGRKR